jgi:hypothetical protein
LSACGAIKYILEESPYTYISFVDATRMITLYTNLDSDIRGATGRKIRGYPEKFLQTYVQTQFAVTITGPCKESDYTPERKAIPAMPNDLIKYVLGADGVKTHEFAFTYTPSICGFFKTYTLSV